MTLTLDRLTSLALQSYYRVPVYQDRNTGAEFFTFIQDKTLVIVFNGTNSLKDWISNIKAFFYSEGKIKIHLGFLKSYLSLKSSLKEDLKKYDYEEIKILGHSSGGAVGALAALDLAKDGTEVTLYSFGSPPVGNKAHAQVCDRRFTHYRFYNKYDLVPYSLPRFLGYYLGGIPIELNWKWQTHHIGKYYFSIHRDIKKYSWVK